MKKTALYIGNIEEIFLEAALIEDSFADDGVVLAQFDNLELPRCWTHAWCPLPRSDFQIYEEDDNI